MLRLILILICIESGSAGLFGSRPPPHSPSGESVVDVDDPQVTQYASPVLSSSGSRDGPRDGGTRAGASGGRGIGALMEPREDARSGTTGKVEMGTKSASGGRSEGDREPWGDGSAWSSTSQRSAGPTSSTSSFVPGPTTLGWGSSSGSSPCPSGPTGSCPDGSRTTPSGSHATTMSPSIAPTPAAAWPITSGQQAVGTPGWENGASVSPGGGGRGGDPVIGRANAENDSLEDRHGHPVGARLPATVLTDPYPSNLPPRVIHQGLTNLNSTYASFRSEAGGILPSSSNRRPVKARENETLSGIRLLQEEGLPPSLRRDCKPSLLANSKSAFSRYWECVRGRDRDQHPSIREHVEMIDMLAHRERDADTHPRVTDDQTFNPQRRAAELSNLVGQSGNPFYVPPGVALLIFPGAALSLVDFGRTAWLDTENLTEDHLILTKIHHDHEEIESLFSTDDQNLSTSAGHYGHFACASSQPPLRNFWLLRWGLIFMVVSMVMAMLSVGFRVWEGVRWF